MVENQDKAPPTSRPRTPTNSTHLKLKLLTPRTPKEDPEAGRVGVNHRRGAIARAMTHEMLECSVETFLNHYAPFQPSSRTVDSLCRKLVHKQYSVSPVQHTDGPIQPAGSEDAPTTPTDFRHDSVWLEFKDKTPSGMVGSEPVVFKALERIIDTLTEPLLGTNGYVDNRQLQYKYKDCPSGDVIGETKGGTFKIDACLIPKDWKPSPKKPSSINTWNAAVIAEFKKYKRAELEQENRLQLVSAANFIMNDDPCRMWIYGITIEDASMSLWYFSRSHSVKSVAFDFIKDYRTFIHIILSFLFATPGEMGFDPTVHRVTYRNKTHYVYEVGPASDRQFYRTTTAIFNPEVLCITGRKTRVWEAVRVTGPLRGQLSKILDGGKKYAVKDVWLNEGAPTEREILDDVFQRLAEVSKDPPKYTWGSETLQATLTEALRDEKYKDYFMNIVTDSRGGSSRSVPKDGVVPNPDILKISPKELTSSQIKRSTDKRSSQMTRASLSGRMDFVASRDKWSQQPSLNREYQVKRQYRLVYSDVGKSLHDAKDLLTAFNGIKDVFIALVLLFLANWVHRDVSTGNIIIMERGGSISGKLSDLEYARRFGSDQDQSPSKDPKTGTPYFMPFEVHSGGRIYTDPPRSPDDSDCSEDLSAQGPTPAIPSASQRLTPYFRFSYDVESLWWVMLWFLLARVDHPLALGLALRVFTYSVKPSPRRGDVFQAPPNDPTVSEAIDPRLSSLFPWIDAIRVRLLISHSKSTPNYEDYARLYGKCWKYLRHVVEKAKQVKAITFFDRNDQPSTPSALMTTGEKRQRDEPSVEAQNEVSHLAPGSSSQVINTVDGLVGEEDQTAKPSKRLRTTVDGVKTVSRHPSKLIRRYPAP